MKILVTGGTGFIGSHFVKIALAAGHEVIAIRRPGSIPRIPVGGPVQWLEADLASVNFDQLGDLSEACLVHLAAAGVNPASVSWSNCFDVNVHQSLACWLNAVSAGIKRIIVCGSCFEYGLAGEKYELIPTDSNLEPTGPYHASKAAASMAAYALAIEKKIELAILRPFHVYGEGEDANRFWPSLRKAAMAGEDFPMTSGEQIRDFVSVEKVASLFLDAATRLHLTSGKPIVRNLGNGVPITLEAFARKYWHQWQAKGKIIAGAVPYRPDEVMRYAPVIDWQ